VFSYHRLVGRPSRLRGFRVGLELQDSRESAGVGGGCCQVSNMLFQLAVGAGLGIVERHRHGFDLFADHQRSVPFGFGATVFYNYRDLRFANPLDCALRIALAIEDRSPAKRADAAAGRGWVLAGAIAAAADCGRRVEVFERDHRFFVHGGRRMRENRICRRITDRSEARTLKLADKMGPQKLALGEPVRGKVFELTIRKARRGRRYPDLVLSELRLWDAAGPLSVVTEDMQQRRQALLEQIAGGPLEEVVDRQYACACCDKRSTRLKLRSNHTFVWYQDDETADGESRSEVFDGAWVVAESKPPAALIKLYGRRHRTAAKFDPYAGNEVESSVRIGGGKLQLVRLADIDPAQFAALVERWQRGPARDRIACLGLPEQDPAAVLERLLVRDAILVRGRAITDLLVHVTR